MLHGPIFLCQTGPVIEELEFTSHVSRVRNSLQQIIWQKCFEEESQYLLVRQQKGRSIIRRV